MEGARRVWEGAAAVEPLLTEGELLLYKVAKDVDGAPRAETAPLDGVPGWGGGW